MKLTSFKLGNLVSNLFTAFSVVILKVGLGLLTIRVSGSKDVLDSCFLRIEGLFLSQAHFGQPKVDRLNESYLISLIKPCSGQNIVQGLLVD